MRDAIDDFLRHDMEQADYESKCPVCDGCGDRITDGTFYEVEYKRKTLRICPGCITERYTRDYITEKEEGYEYF